MSGPIDDPNKLIVENKQTGGEDIKEPQQSKKKQETIATPQKAPKETKMISLHPDELIKWDKKLKDLSGQVKNLTNQNNNLKSQLASSIKRTEERRIQDRQGLQQTVNELQKILSDTSNNLAKLQKQRDRLKDDLTIERENKVSRQKEIETLRDVSSEYFLLKQQVNRLEGQSSQLRKSQQNVRQIEQTNNKLQERVVELQEQLKQSRETVAKFESQNLSMKMEKNRLLQESNDYREKYEQQKQQSTLMTEKLQMYQMQIKDFQKERELAAKRFNSEMKQIRETLSKELKLKTKLTDEIQNLKKEVQQRNDKYAGKSERFLAVKLEEMQLQNTALKESTERVSEQNSKLLEKLKEKDVSIVILTKELAKTWPNLEDSEGLEYVEKEIIEIGKKQKINYGEIIEKVMIENLRLKYSIQTIGSEYNEQLRRKKTD